MSASVLLHGIGDGRARIDVSANVPLDGGNGAWLPASLPIAMWHDKVLRISGSQDNVSLANSREAQQLLASWYEDLCCVDIVADAEPVDSPPTMRGIGCFFSGGADSFYSAIERSEDITHLIFVTGFDIDVDDEALSEQALSATREAARSLGKELIEVRTNIRHVSGRFLDWGTHYHGAALATVGLLLGEVLERVIIPASYHVDDLFPWGSHPKLDPLWNSSSVKFEHHGELATRPEKVARIAENSAAMDHLRICWENPDGAFNCGTCEKCIRTMINLRLVDALVRCRTLPDEVDVRQLRSFRAGHGAAIFAKQNLKALKAHGITDKELVRALKMTVWKAHVLDSARAVRRALRRFRK